VGAEPAVPARGAVAGLTRSPQRRRTFAGTLKVCAIAAVLAAGACLGSAFAREAATSAPTRCEGMRVVVHGGSPADAALICDGARAAIGFFAGQQLDTAIDVRVEVVPALPEKADPSAVGCYVPAQRRVYVLPYAEFARRENWFGVPVEQAMYRSLASHEMAHAIAACNFRAERPPLAAVEYVGYVAMLSVMQPDLRSRVLAANPGEGYDADPQINSTVYLMDPTRFAVESYRHFLRPGNGPRYLRALLDGSILLD
jgi:hypothetical protein